MRRDRHEPHPVDVLRSARYAWRCGRVQARRVKASLLSRWSPALSGALFRRFGSNRYRRLLGQNRRERPPCRSGGRRDSHTRGSATSDDVSFPGCFPTSGGTPQRAFPTHAAAMEKNNEDRAWNRHRRGGGLSAQPRQPLDGRRVKDVLQSVCRRRPRRRHRIAPGPGQGRLEEKVLGVGRWVLGFPNA